MRRKKKAKSTYFKNERNESELKKSTEPKPGRHDNNQIKHKGVNKIGN